MSSSSPDVPAWAWPAGRALVLYHWSWFEPAIGNVVVGWSQRNTLDTHGFVHLAAESTQPARSLTVDLDLDPIVEAHTFSVLNPLPLSLLEEDGRPLPWVSALLDTL